MRFLESLDQVILSWFENHQSPLVTAIMRDLTALGGHVTLTLVVLFTIGLLLALRRYQTALFVLGAVVGGIALVAIIKNFVGRERPELEIPRSIPLPISPSFPSGHSMLSAVIYFTLALLVAGRIKGRRVHAYLIGCSLLLTFLIGLSRMYLGVHYFTDVVAGWSGGLAWALAWRWIEDHWLRFHERAVDVGEENATTPAP